MKLNYILSNTTNCATTAALKSVIEKSQKNLFDNFIVIVPEPKSIAIERELLDLSSQGAFCNVYVYSFLRLLNKIGKIEEDKIVSRQTCIMLLRKIIIENYDNFVCYQKTSKTNSFAEKIYETIQQFKSSGVTPEDVKLMIEKCDKSLKAKYSDIFLIYSEYEHLLGETLFDDCDKLKQLSLLAKNSEFIKNSEIFVVGFDNVTFEMISVLKEFATHSKEITFSCCYFNENRKDKYIQNNELYKKFVSIAEQLKYPYVPKFVSSTEKGDFWNLQNYLFSTENKKVKPNGNVCVLELQNKNQEIDFVANQILNEINSGKRFKDIAIIDTELETDRDILEKTLKEYDIPYFISGSYDISRHYFVEFIKDSFEMINSHFMVENVLKWISNPLLKLDNLSEFLNYVEEFGINHSAFFELVSEKVIDNVEKAEKINAVIEKIAAFNQKFGNSLLNDNSVSYFIETIEKMTQFYDAENVLNELSIFEKENDLLVESELSLAIFNRFKTLNDNLKRFMGDVKTSSQEFLQIYISGFGSEEINLVPLSIDAVLVQKNTDGLYKIDDLFIVGAVDGKFPAKMQDSGIILDSELEQSKVVIGKSIEPSINQINKRENYKVYETMILPTQKLFVSFADNTFGVMNKPARVVLRILNLFDIEPQKYYAKNSVLSKNAAIKNFAEDVGEYLTRTGKNKHDINEEYSKLIDAFPENFKNYIENMCFSKTDFSISDAKELYFLNDKTSISQLEKYFSCPYSFFARYGLRLKENKSAKLSSLDIGTIIHKFAELFIDNIDSFKDLNDTEFISKVEKILGETFEYLNVNTKKNIALLKFISDESKRLAKYLFNEQQNSNFKNDSKLNEFEFKGANSVKLKVGDKIISIEGKIDRIDRFNDYVRIIDYKTGDVLNSLGSIYYGEKIQLISYLSAVEKVTNGQVAGLFYFPIHSDFVKLEQKMKNNYKMSGFLLNDIDVIKNMDLTLSFDNPDSQFVPLKIRVNKDTTKIGEFQISHSGLKCYLSKDEFENMKIYNVKLCSNAVSEILDGYIEPSPISKINDKESEECKYCEFAGFCGKENAKFGNGRKCNFDVTNESFVEDSDGD